MSAAPPDAVFHALANATRREVVERLGQGAASMSELAEPFEMALPTFYEHLRVLETAGIISSHKQGRVRTYRLNPKPLAEMQDWLAAQRTLWERRLNQLDEFLKNPEEP